MTLLPSFRAAGVACAVFATALAACRDGTGSAPADDWRTELPSGFYHWSGKPAVARGRVFVEADGDLVALDARSGAVLWRRRVGWKDAAFATNIVVHDGVVFVADSTNVHALDEASGDVRWRIATGEAHGCEALADDSTLYTGTRDRTVLALRQRDGTARWSRDLFPDRSIPGPVQGIARVGDTLYVSATRFEDRNGVQRTGVVVALDRRDGRELWRWMSKVGRGDFNSAPTVAGRFVLLGDRESAAFVAIDRFTGRSEWRASTRSGYIGPNVAPIVVDGTVYAAAGDAYVYALRLETGEEIWRTYTDVSNTHIAWCAGRLLVQGQGVSIIHPWNGRIVAVRFADMIDYTTAGFAVEGTRVFTAGPLAAYAFRCR